MCINTHVNGKSASLRSALVSRKTFHTNKALCARKSTISRGVGTRTVVLSTNVYPDPEFIETTLNAFPEKGVAHVEEARALYSDGGYTYLDVRSEDEYDADGKVPNAVNIPLINTKRKWNLDTMVLEVEQSANPEFLNQIKAKFPDKDTPLLISCSDGTQRCIQALILLDGEGYTNIVGLKGGFIKWFETFDSKLIRRKHVHYETVYQADGDAMGIHSTGAGFSRVDSMDPNLAKFDQTEWLNWKEEVAA